MRSAVARDCDGGQEDNDDKHGYSDERTDQSAGDSLTERVVLLAYRKPISVRVSLVCHVHNRC